VIAFFDMDLTVLRINSGTAWVRFLRRRGEISRLRLLRAMGWALQYRLSILDMESLSERLVADLEGDAEHEMVDKCALWYRTEIERTIAADARRAIARHRDAGDRVVLLTSATPYIAAPLQATLGLDDVICSRLEVAGGRFTGRVIKPICYGPGKVKLAEAWTRERGLALAAASFYTDSYTDLPMLERVGRPIAVNPDPRLHRTARQRGWRVERWS
jgi:HAD superfamily hydrolase (TIGR01490 family)